MLRLGERATRVPAPRQASGRLLKRLWKVVVHGEVYNVWSLLEAGFPTLDFDSYRGYDMVQRII